MILTGDESAHQVALKQPVKLAAMEGLYEGKTDAGIVGIGVLNPNKTITNNEEPFLFELEAPYALSFLGYHDIHAFVPGLKDLVYGNEKYNIESAQNKIEKGKIAINALKEYKKAKKENDLINIDKYEKILTDNMKYFGYGHLKSPEDIVPPIPITFYTFHLMVALGSWFLLLFALVLFFTLKREVLAHKWLLISAVASIPLGYIASEAGWIVAEVGRQPWAIQDLMPVGIAVTDISSSNVKTTFFMFAFLFTLLLIAEIKIMISQIKIGPEGGH